MYIINVHKAFWWPVRQFGRRSNDFRSTTLLTEFALSHFSSFYSTLNYAIYVLSTDFQLKFGWVVYEQSRLFCMSHWTRLRYQKLTLQMCESSNYLHFHSKWSHTNAWIIKLSSFLLKMILYGERRCNKLQ